MKCFVGIVPPQPLYGEIALLQKQFGDNRTEPHITLMPPIEIPEPAAWLAAIDQVAGTFSPLTITLTGTGYFANKVLFISVESVALVQLEAALTAACSRFGVPAFTRGNGYHPHLTLGRTNVGFSQHALGQMEGLANEMLHQPFSFTAGAFRVYHKPVVHERYKILRDINFSMQPGL